MTPQQKKGLIYSVVGLLTLMVGGLIYAVKKQVDLAKQMSVRLSGGSMLPMQGSEIGVKLSLSIDNKSDLTIHVDSINMDIYVNDKYINKVIQKSGQTINPKSTSQVEFSIYINPADLINGLNIPELLKTLDYKSIKIKMIGLISGDIDGITFTDFPFQVVNTIGELVG
jgi:LEA14-like dessication related protein